MLWLKLFYQQHSLSPRLSMHVGRACARLELHPITVALTILAVAVTMAPGGPPVKKAAFAKAPMKAAPFLTKGGRPWGPAALHPPPAKGNNTGHAPTPKVPNPKGRPPLLKSNQPARVKPEAHVPPAARVPKTPPGDPPDPLPPFQPVGKAAPPLAVPVIPLPPPAPTVDLGILMNVAGFVTGMMAVAMQAPAAAPAFSKAASAAAAAAAFEPAAAAAKAPAAPAAPKVWAKAPPAGAALPRVIEIPVGGGLESILFDRVTGEMFSHWGDPGQWYRWSLVALNV